jgi:methylmalonyl-CoA mutase
VEEAVYREFDSLSERGGVLGAMETMYQRGKIQEESLYYEQKKHDGSLPIVGVNTFLPDKPGGEQSQVAELIRSTEQEKRDQVVAVRAFNEARAGRQPAALARLQAVAASGGNVFAELIEAVKVASLGRISNALYAVGGQYRRNM